MNIVDIIIKKRNGNELTKEEIEYFINGYVDGSIEEYQASALLMAIYFRGMTDDELFNLTDSMIKSGDTIDLSQITGIKVDKHSTGGVGDKTTLVVGPILASLGIKFAKMSGRGLGHTGGTLDKLESIPGYKTSIPFDKFIKQVNDINISIIGQSMDLVPADKKLYALRDVTGTVESIPLIAASIMSKKLAVSTDIISLDVKLGNGAFMNNIDDAKELATLMIKIAKKANRGAFATITNMDEPLGEAIGNSLEVIEAVNTLNDKGPKDFTELCVDLAGEIIYEAKMSSSIEMGKTLAYEQLKNGKALESFKACVKAQGGDISYIDDPNKFRLAEKRLEVKAKRDGYIEEIDTKGLGLASSHLGAGREKITDKINHSTGILSKVKVGDMVKVGDILAIIYSDLADTSKVIEEVKASYKIGQNKNNLKLIYEVIR
ncbi:MAG: thymidine phosphorylase [Acholeplasmatales bacterium]|nr:thymidine phosphorylase [Acholeplasmatales bacterium]